MCLRPNPKFPIKNLNLVIHTAMRLFRACVSIKIRSKKVMSNLLFNHPTILKNFKVLSTDSGLLIITL